MLETLNWLMLSEHRAERGTWENRTRIFFTCVAKVCPHHCFWPRRQVLRCYHLSGCKLAYIWATVIDLWSTLSRNRTKNPHKVCHLSRWYIKLEHEFFHLCIGKEYTCNQVQCLSRWAVWREAAWSFATAWEYSIGVWWEDTFRGTQAEFLGFIHGKKCIYTCLEVTKNYNTIKMCQKHSSSPCCWKNEANQVFKQEVNAWFSE